MAAANSVAADDLEIVWNDTAWLQHFPLNEESVMHYFSISPFYDRTCNNEVIKMQNMDPSHLLNMEGIEYVLVSKQEPVLYIIKKQRRLGPRSVSPLAIYHVLNGSIFRSPDLYSILNSRLYTALHHLHAAFAKLQGCSTFEGAGVYTFDREKPQKATAAAATAEVTAEAADAASAAKDSDVDSVAPADDEQEDAPRAGKRKRAGGTPARGSRKRLKSDMEAEEEGAADGAIEEAKEALSAAATDEAAGMLGKAATAAKAGTEGEVAGGASKSEAASKGKAKSKPKPAQWSLARYLSLDHLVHNLYTTSLPPQPSLPAGGGSSVGDGGGDADAR